MRYLQETSNLGILGSQEAKIMRYVDSDFARDIDARRSQSGWIFKLRQCIIRWKENLQTIVALSTTNTNYIACTEAVNKALWLKGITRELGLTQK